MRVGSNQHDLAVTLLRRLEHGHTPREDDTKTQGEDALHDQEETLEPTRAADTLIFSGLQNRENMNLCHLSYPVRGTLWWYRIPSKLFSFSFKGK